MGRPRGPSAGCRGAHGQAVELGGRDQIAYYDAFASPDDDAADQLEISMLAWSDADATLERAARAGYPRPV